MKDQVTFNDGYIVELPAGVCYQHVVLLCQEYSCHLKDYSVSCLQPILLKVCRNFCNILWKYDIWCLHVQVCTNVIAWWLYENW